MTEEEKFFAWLDGELSDSDAAEMAARVKGDPELRELARRHRALNARLDSAFAPIAEAPVPADVAESINSRSNANVVQLEPRSARALPSGLPQWALIAATLALGLFTGTMIPRGNEPIELEGGGIYAAGELGDALDTQLASAPAGGDVRIGVTFRNTEGAICRTFTGQAATGLACHSGDKWKVRGLFPASEGQQSEFRMASGMNPQLAALLDSSMAGEPFDASQEAAAKQGGWR